MSKPSRPLSLVNPGTKLFDDVRTDAPPQGMLLALNAGSSSLKFARHSPRISADGARVAVFMIRTDEELLMARLAYRVIGTATSTKV